MIIKSLLDLNKVFPGKQIECLLQKGIYYHKTDYLYFQKVIQLDNGFYYEIKKPLYYPFKLEEFKELVDQSEKLCDKISRHTICLNCLFNGGD